MPIITPDILKEQRFSPIGCASVNTAECIVQSSLYLYEAEFGRAYKIMRKIQKGKLVLSDLMAPYDSFMFTKE
jgi:hypothetical protein